MLLILDFDYTLFNTALLKKALQQALRKHGVSDELFLSSMEESKGGGRDYKPDRQFEILQARGIWNVSDLRRSFNEVLGNSHIFLYDDTISFLANMKPRHALTLLTYGEDAFQNAKINGCGTLAQFFEKVVITQNILKDKEAKSLSENKKAVFVDDNPAALFAAKKYAPHIVSVRMKRGEGPYNNEASGEGVDCEVKDLEELVKIIEAQNNKQS